MNRADPDCGTTFAWMTQVDGPVARLAGRLGDRRRRRARDAEPRLRSPATTRSSCSATTTRRRSSVTIVGIVWIVVMTRDLLHRDRAVGAHPAGPARRSSSFTLIAVRGRRAGQGLRQPPGALGRSRPRRGSTRSTISQLQRARRRHPAGGVHLLGVGLRASASTRRPRTPSTAPGRAAIISTFILVAIYLLVATAAQAYGGLSPGQQPERRVRAARQGRARLAARQAADHRRADVGVGLDADDDPADRAHDAVDGALRRRSRSSSATSTRASSARASRRSGWAPSRRSCTSFLSATSHDNLIGDAFTSLALTIAFYYGFTGFACVVYYRRHLFESVKNFVFIGVLPFVGGAVLTFVLVKAVIDYSQAALRLRRAVPRASARRSRSRWS